MPGQTHLPTLLAELAPRLQPGEFVFISVPGARYGELAELEPIAVMVESEGLSLVVPQPLADHHGHAHAGRFRCITLTVHSSLEAVGLTAAVASVLAEAGISANVIAGALHDHVFVPTAAAERAIWVLDGMGGSGTAGGSGAN